MADSPPIPGDPGRPTVARLHDVALGGKDNYAADREMAAKLEEIFPLATALALESREFQARAVDYVAHQGVTQFIDVGSGMPASPATHEVAAKVSPDARVAYVDNDPVVNAHAAALLARPGQVASVPGDLRRPAEILASPELTSLIDTSKPYCVILAMILNFVPAPQAAQITAEFRDAMPPGSYLVVSLGVNEHAPDLAQDFIDAYVAAPVHLHTRAQVAGYFAGLELVDPGVTEARHWRPVESPADSDTADTAPRPADALVGVGRRP
jgi:hypothetical protein